MRYVHFRDSKRRVRATLAFEGAGKLVYYGVAVVSPRDLNCKASPKLGRTIADGRCTIAMGRNAHHPRRAMWRSDDEIVQTFYGAGLEKFGTASEEFLRGAIQSLKTAVKEVND